jgi:hypothetical protein
MAGFREQVRCGRRGRRQDFADAGSVRDDFANFVGLARPGPRGENPRLCTFESINSVRGEPSMSAAKQHEHLATIKRELAAKYFSLANVTKSTPKRKAFLYRAERYTNQAAVLSRKAQIK